MSFIQSLSMIVPAQRQKICNRLMRALDRDSTPDPGNTFSVQLSASGDNKDPVSHYGAHTWDDDLLAILDSGSLPNGINWSRFLLTKATASQALNAIKYQAVTSNVSARVNFNNKASTEGVRKVKL